MIFIHKRTQFVSVLLGAGLDDAVRHEPIMLKLMSMKNPTTKRRSYHGRIAPSIVNWFCNGRVRMFHHR